MSFCGAETWTLLVADMKTLHGGFSRGVSDIYAAAYVYNACRGAAEIGLSTIGGILRHRRLSLFSHVARSGAGVYQHMMLCI